MNTCSHIDLICKGKKNKYGPVNFRNQEQMIKEGLHPPYLQPLEKNIKKRVGSVIEV